jgi:hypothetical protein
MVCFLLRLPVEQPTEFFVDFHFTPMGLGPSLPEFDVGPIPFCEPPRAAPFSPSARRPPSDLVWDALSRVPDFFHFPLPVLHLIRTHLPSTGTTLLYGLRPQHVVRRPPTEFRLGTMDYGAWACDLSTPALSWVKLDTVRLSFHDPAMALFCECVQLWRLHPCDDHLLISEGNDGLRTYHPHHRPCSRHSVRPPRIPDRLSPFGLCAIGSLSHHGGTDKPNDNVTLFLGTSGESLEAEARVGLGSLSSPVRIRYLSETGELRDPDPVWRTMVWVPLHQKALIVGSTSLWWLQTTTDRHAWECHALSGHDSALRSLPPIYQAVLLPSKYRGLFPSRPGRRGDVVAFVTWRLTTEDTILQQYFFYDVSTDTFLPAGHVGKGETFASSCPVPRWTTGSDPPVLRVVDEFLVWTTPHQAWVWRGPHLAFGTWDLLPPLPVDFTTRLALPYPCLFA